MNTPGGRACMVAGGVYMVAPRGCVVASGGIVHGCSGGACVVAPGGAWVVYDEIQRYDQ